MIEKHPGGRPEKQREIVMNLEKPFYGIDEAAAAVGMHSNTIRRHIASGKLHASRPGKLYRISREDLIAWVQSPAFTEPVQPSARVHSMEELQLLANRIDAAASWLDSINSSVPVQDASLMQGIHAMQDSSVFLRTLVKNAKAHMNQG